MAYCVCTQLHSFSFGNLSFHFFLCLMCGSLSVHYDAPWKLSKIIQLLINSISKYALLCLTLFKISPSIWETRRPLHNAALNTIFLSFFISYCCVTTAKNKLVLLIDEGACFYLLHDVFFFCDLLNIISCLKNLCNCYLWLFFNGAAFNNLYRVAFMFLVLGTKEITSS